MRAPVVDVHYHSTGRKEKHQFLRTHSQRSEHADFTGVTKPILRGDFPYSGQTQS
jgi:hypothetical protein